MSQTQLKEYRDKRTEDIRNRESAACRSVMDSYEQIKSCFGSAGALDYARVTGGRGAMHSEASKHLPLLDFLIDVENTLSETLTTGELDKHFADLLDTERTVTSEELLSVEEKLGRQFMGRGICPVNQYFNPQRKALPKDRI